MPPELFVIRDTSGCEHVINAHQLVELCGTIPGFDPRFQTLRLIDVDYTLDAETAAALHAWLDWRYGISDPTQSHGKREALDNAERALIAEITRRYKLLDDDSSELSPLSRQMWYDVGALIGLLKRLTT